MKQVYAPGCTFMLYKPELAEKLSECLSRVKGTVGCRNTLMGIK